MSLSSWILLVALALSPGPALPTAKEVSLPAEPSARELAARRAALAREVGTGLVWVDAHGEGEGEEVGIDFYYLTGLRVGGARLLVRARDGKDESILFLPAKDCRWEIWHGDRLAPGDGAKKRTGVRAALSLAEFDEELARSLESLKRVFLPPNQPASADPAKEQLDWVRKHEKEIAVGVYSEPVHKLRQRKSSYEIGLLREAIGRTHRGLESGMARARAGVYEFQVEAAIEGTFMTWGSRRPGFPSIVGAGPNSCVLHYMANRRQIEEGEMLVMDVGATALGYTADITRSIPV